MSGIYCNNIEFAILFSKENAEYSSLSSYIKDTVVVQSVDNVKSGDEIFNCYGPDYRYLERNNRLDHLSSFYNFDCRCEICINPLLELVSHL